MNELRAGFRPEFLNRLDEIILFKPLTKNNIGEIIHLLMEDLNSRLPGIGDYVTARDGSKGEVSSVNVLRQLVKVIVTLENEEKEIREYKVEELRFKPRRKKEKGGKNQNHGHDFQDKELKELEALEKKEGKSKLNDK